MIKTMGIRPEAISCAYGLAENVLCVTNMIGYDKATAHDGYVACGYLPSMHLFDVRIARYDAGMRCMRKVTMAMQHMFSK